LDLSIQRISAGIQVPQKTAIENLARELKRITNQEEKTVAGKLDRDYWHQHFEELLKKLNLAVDLFHLEFKREIHQGTGEIMVSIINKETGEILRQIPPEKILDMVAEMLKQLGLTVDVQA